MVESDKYTFKLKKRNKYPTLLLCVHVYIKYFGRSSGTYRMLRIEKERMCVNKREQYVYEIWNQISFLKQYFCSIYRLYADVK